MPPPSSSLLAGTPLSLPATLTSESSIASCDAMAPSSSEFPAENI